MTDTTRMRIFALGLTLGVLCGFLASAVAAISLFSRCYA